MNNLERYEYYKSQQERKINFEFTNYAMADIERRLKRRPARIQAIIDFENFINHSENQISQIANKEVRESKLDKLKELYKIHDMITQIISAEMYALAKLDEAKERIIELEKENYDLATRINVLEM